MSIPVQESQQHQQHQESNYDSDARSSIFNFDDDEDERDRAEPSSPSSSSFDKSSIAHLISSYGSSSSTAWLEFSRYKIWQAPASFLAENPTATFLPIQGYMRHKQYIFAWGNPLASHASLLGPTAKAFVSWAVDEQKAKPVWCCTDLALETVLANNDKERGLGWSAVECIHEEVLDPDHILNLTNAKGKEGVGAVKDLKKNLRRAERAGVSVEETTENWSQHDRQEVEDGLLEWRRSKGLKGVQLASTTGLPWIDEQHRRYLVARHEGHIVGILILTPIHGPYQPPASEVSSVHASTPVPTVSPLKQKRKFFLPALGHHKSSPETSPERGASGSTTSSGSASSSDSESPIQSPMFSSHSLSSSSSSLDTDFSLDIPSKSALTSRYYLIKNAISFPSAPRGTSEFLIHTSLELLQKASPSRPPKVTFGITASDTLHPRANLSGWKIAGLSKVYSKVAGTAGLLKRGDFRAKFDSGRVPMYVCYPTTEGGFGIEGVKALLKVLKK
ncbi:hypothetical protein E1B28_002516 [Marasmius oreades]|uniref:Phosphatidylglycerol lysyltransferase C-terminal domain-containing protein n=1 Tax=Marasmius oreades TaxID=181124 RepID=A0A9P7UP12_9AGAR|nr:uncharacterized protein E1B28_002516 [Marasmius oreades]KAG7086569.1 hypothetical protein E1B28_002516 [Marasmius oreades]